MPLKSNEHLKLSTYPTSTFCIIDFDDDDIISSDDLAKVIKTLTGEGQQLQDSEIQQMISKVRGQRIEPLTYILYICYI